MFTEPLFLLSGSFLVYRYVFVLFLYIFRFPCHFSCLLLFTMSKTSVIQFLPSTSTSEIQTILRKSNSHACLLFSYCISPLPVHLSSLPPKSLSFSYGSHLTVSRPHRMFLYPVLSASTSSIVWQQTFGNGQDWPEAHKIPGAGFTNAPTMVKSLVTTATLVNRK